MSTISGSPLRLHLTSYSVALSYNTIDNAAIKDRNMFVLYKIFLVILAISFFTFVSFFGRLPALRRTPIGWLYRLLCIQIPNGARRLDQKATGGNLTLKSQRLGQYLFYESNPVILVNTLQGLIPATSN